MTEDRQTVYQAEGCRYRLLPDGTAEILSCRACAADDDVPGVLDGHPVSSVGFEAYAGISHLESVTVPEGITRLDRRAFAGCEALTEVTLPRSLTEVGEGLFAGCEELAVVTIPPDHPVLALVDGVLFDRPHHRLLWYPAGREDTALLAL